jgi:hypothetical protein
VIDQSDYRRDATVKIPVFKQKPVAVDIATDLDLETVRVAMKPTALVLIRYPSGQMVR